MFKYNDININYKDYGLSDGNTIVYLHGWGQNIAMMEPIANPHQETHRLIILDLPGFGHSNEPTYPWTLDDYVEMVHALLTSLNITEPNLVGHSFGGKISLLYASKYKVKRLLILAAPFKCHKPKETFKVKVFKTMKKVPLLKPVVQAMKRHVGSTDYRNATPIMRDILVKHVNYDISEYITKIKCPTFIIWGDLDEAVPVSDAHILENLITDSGLTIYEGCTHYAYLERLNQTNAIIKSFMN